MPEREKAERDEEQRQEEDVAAGQGEHENGNEDADPEAAQHVDLPPNASAWRRTMSPYVLRHAIGLPVAAHRLVCIARSRQVLAS